MNSPLLCIASALLPLLSLRAAELLPVSVGLPQAAPARTGDGVSGGARWAAEGRQVFFVSGAKDLVEDDANGSVLDVFRRQLESGFTERVSIAGSLAGESGPVLSFDVSADGRHLVFSRIGSDPALGDTNGVEDVYWRDLETGVTRLVSSRPDGSAGTGPSGGAVLSADGRHVTFESLAGDLEPVEDTQGRYDVFLKDLQSGTLERILPTDPAGWMDARDPLMSADGGVVVVNDGRWGSTDDLTELPIRVWRRTTGAVERLRLPLPVPGPGSVNVEQPVLSDDGRSLAFVMTSGVAGLTGLWWTDLTTGEMTRISAELTLAPDTLTLGPSLSADGRTVAFVVEPESSSSPQMPIRIWKAGAGLFTLDQLQTTAPPVGNDPRSWEPVLSPDASGLLFVSDDRIPEAGVLTEGAVRLFHRDLASGVTRLLDENPGHHPAVFSPDGSQVALETQDPAVIPGDDNEAADVVTVSLRDLSRGLVSMAVPGAGTFMAAGSSRTGVGISDDGRRLGFTSQADDLVAGDTNRSGDHFVFDREPRTNRVVSARADGRAPGHAVSARLSRQGRHVVFSQQAAERPTSPEDPFSSIYVRDLETGELSLASAGDGSDLPMSGTSTFPVISSDGRRVGFQQESIVSVRLDRRIYVRDRWLRRTWWLNDPALMGGEFTSASRDPLQISCDGTVALFHNIPYSWFLARLWERSSPSLTSINANLAELSADGRFVFLFRTGLATRPPNEPGFFRLSATDGSERRLLPAQPLAMVAFRPSADGTVVTYHRHPPPLERLRHVYALCVATGVEERISDAPDGTPGSGDSVEPTISADGRFIAFRSEASNLVAGDTNGVQDVFVHDRYTGTTTLLSRDADGALGDNGSTRPEISADGRWVAFTTFAGNLLPGDHNRLGDVAMVAVTRAAAPDTDADGLPDGWERDRFGTLDPDGGADSDRDGFSDREEWQTGTAPDDPASRLEVAVTASDSGEPQLMWRSHAGIAYQIQRGNTLGTAWESSGDPVAGYEGISRRSVGPGLYRIQASRNE
ncbi:MAG: PD40 domain-containing protein [Verrucomicrobia bacterium]|nr:PD40 domain-containing protein [Verrucomicrobiota bacterium]